jgi:hypothetical protein
VDAAERLERLRSLAARVDEAKQELDAIDDLGFEARQGISANLVAARSRIEWAIGRIQFEARLARRQADSGRATQAG